MWRERIFIFLLHRIFLKEIKGKFNEFYARFLMIFMQNYKNLCKIIKKISLNL